VEEAPAGIDVQAVTAWFAKHVPAARPPLRFEKIAGGRSNLTFQVTDAQGGRWALRRPPLRSVLASAHDVGREARIMSALAPTDVPVPVVAGHCTDDSVNGAPFFVMDFVEGHILRDTPTAEELSLDARRHAAEAMIDGLVKIHAVDPDAVGLGDLGRKEGYIERQLRRWHGQWEKSKTRELPAIDEVHDRLRERIPEQGPATIVHGDYRLDNTIVSASGDLLAVLDWELCTLGDPLADVGLLLVYWSRPYGAGPTAADGFPPIVELIDRYARESGRDLSELAFYEAFSAWRIAVILEGVYARTRAGAYGDRGGTDGLVEAVNGLAERAARAVL
jgi:aminoglycoside phosphotransferase (APT) family kinase protein